MASARPAKDGIVARCPEVAEGGRRRPARRFASTCARDALPAPEDDEFYLADLIGLAAATPQGEALGRVKAVQNFGAGDILELDTGDGRPTRYIPASPASRRAGGAPIAEGRIVVVLAGRDRRAGA